MWEIKMEKRLIGMLLAFCMMLSLLPVLEFAAQSAAIAAIGKFSLDDEKITRAEMLLRLQATLKHSVKDDFYTALPCLLHL